MKVLSGGDFGMGVGLVVLLGESSSASLNAAYNGLFRQVVPIDRLGAHNARADDPAAYIGSLVEQRHAQAARGQN